MIEIEGATITGAYRIVYRLSPELIEVVMVVHGDNNRINYLTKTSKLWLSSWIAQMNRVLAA